MVHYSPLREAYLSRLKREAYLSHFKREEHLTTMANIILFSHFSEASVEPAHLKRRVTHC
ncbi:hypothetical protein ALTERO38_50010 [Alteromonas sp. 38]|nr:hypothetical protein ALTER154_90222 [Alteromonas sp. 154]VXB16416.1 hypothetical protein ALTERO38_50010 [Alteromonas sp. 38]